MARFIEEGGVGAFQHAIDDDDLTIWKAFDVSTQPSFAFINDDGTFETLRGALGESGIAQRIEALKAS